MSHFTNINEAIRYIFKTRDAVRDTLHGLDEATRDITPTRNLLLATHLLDTPREYVVVTGSKGKGSIVALTASLLRSLGHKVGMVTSPHLRFWTERIRVNGQAIPEADFMRILSELKPLIDAEALTLAPNRYISPQGIFLLVALSWFNEQGANCAVLEVGRGGRYDDMALVPNKVSLFAPMFIEHAQYLGDSIERIAWHKAGIIKTGSYVYSLAQEPPALNMLEREAQSKDSEFFWFSSLDIGEFIADTPNGLLCRIGRYGECELPLFGRYQIANASLAIQAAGNMHARLGGIPHASEEYVQRIKQGLLEVRWHGRLQQMQTAPTVFLEGAINPLSVDAFVESVQSRSTRPIIAVAGVPADRDMAGAFERLSAHCDHLILTQTTFNPSIKFAPPADALAIARQFNPTAQYIASFEEAIAHAKERAGTAGTVWLCVAQPLVGEAMMIWDVDTHNV